MQIPPPQIDPEQARRTADDVLSGRAYTNAARPPSLQERLFDRIAEMFSDLLNSLSSTGGRGVIAWIAIAVFVALIAFLLNKLVRNFRPVPSVIERPEPTVALSKHQSAREWIAAATEAERDGDFRLGIRCRHQALVSGLVERRALTAGPDQTAGEIRQTITRDFPAAATSINEATTLFQDTWYGWLSADEQSRDRFVDLARQIDDTCVRTANVLVAT